MPLIKSVAPVLMSGSVASVTSYGCYTHISHPSPGSSTGTGQSKLPPATVEEPELKPNVVDTTGSLENVNNTTREDSPKVDAQGGNVNSTNPEIEGDEGAQEEQSNPVATSSEERKDDIQSPVKTGQSEETKIPDSSKSEDTDSKLEKTDEGEEKQEGSWTQKISRTVSSWFFSF